MKETNRLRVRYKGPEFADGGVDMEPEEDDDCCPPFTRHVLGPLTVLCGPIQEGCGSKILATVHSGQAVELIDQSGKCGDAECEQCDKAACRGWLLTGLKQGDVIVCCNAIHEDDSTSNCFLVLDSVYRITNGAAVSLGSWKDKQ